MSLRCQGVRALFTRASAGEPEMKEILVTGAAGFIGMHTTEFLLARGDAVVGLDNLNSYYEPSLKEARLAKIRSDELK